ncbi:MAG: hypothetical protein KAX53_03665 [Saprospiraceae bacterium]|nr:hypothetical protein [Saprospiraceae bacterium]MBK6665623.1 hypothetical protein [Saprospiraceae bacterium]MBK8886805.1 hypothetical protein [Saprospiraceae bacterium]MBP8212815.1 hypothetical protein [Saprospiraceae bacterium]HQV65577.1 hypothetical protein [Saprospiraceae bacterium]
MKHIFTVLLIFSLSSYMQGQNHFDYIKQELSNLETKLTKNGEKSGLTNEQTAQLTKILEDKALRIENYKKQYKQKDELSKFLMQLENEYTPRIQAVLTTQQRRSIQK